MNEQCYDYIKKDWETKGYFIFNNFFENNELKKIIETLDKITFENTNDFGSKNKFLEFPNKYNILNKISLHPKIINICQTLLNTQDIRLIQSDIWSKTNDGVNPEFTNSDQRIHMDFPNNYLTHIPPWNKPESVSIIIYYSDSNICGGRTSVVPRKNSDDVLYNYPYFNKISGLCANTFYNNKNKAEQFFNKHYPNIYKFRQKLYDTEILVDFKPGTVLFYRHDLWHRGTPVHFNKTRIVQNIGYKKAGCDWITNWNLGWARSLCNGDQYLDNLITTLTKKQLNCLGFPVYNKKLLDKETLLATRCRYPKYLSNL